MTDSASPTAPPSVTHHLPVLDGIRGLAILLVMPVHFWGLPFGIAGHRPSNVLDRNLEHLVRSGWVGVDLFFVLSGFLITGILIDSRGFPSYFRSFYARRFLRIFPLYYGFLLVMLVAVPHIGFIDRVADIDNLRANQWWYWAYAMNVGTAFTNLNFSGTLVHPQFWSLAVEEQFYLIWPTIVLLLRRRSLTILCVALLFGCLALRAFLVSDAASGFAAANAAHVLTPARMDTFALGALLAIAVRSGSILTTVTRFAAWMATAAFAVLTALFIVNDGLPILDRWIQTIGFSAVGLFFAALLAMVVTAAPETVLNRIFTAAPMTWFGRYAYGLYVVHVLVAFVMADRILHLSWAQHIYLREIAGSQTPSNIATTLTGIAISCAIAWMSWHLYESQLLKLKRFFPYGGERFHTGAAPLPSASGEHTAVPAS